MNFFVAPAPRSVPLLSLPLSARCGAMKPWFLWVPPWFFSVGKYLYLEEFLGLASFIVFTIVIWVLVAVLPSFSVLVGGIVNGVVAVVLAIPSLWPRVHDALTDHETIKDTVKNPYSARPEVLRGEVSIDSDGAFRDREGRRVSTGIWLCARCAIFGSDIVYQVYLRGVNLSGNTKLPTGSTSTLSSCASTLRCPVLTHVNCRQA